MIVLDTHVWVWWIGQPDRLTSSARTAIDGAVGEADVRISSISTWEVALLVERGRLALNQDVSAWIAASEALPFVRFVPVDNAIAVASVRLPEPLHRDPADRMIAATAIELGAPLITADEKLRGYRPLETIW